MSKLNPAAITAQTCEPAADRDAHRWHDRPVVWADDPPGVSWWTCLRCPAQVLVDHEQSTGWPSEPSLAAVVYPPSSFEQAGCCACPRKADGTPVHLTGCDELLPATSRALSIEAIAAAEPPPGYWHNHATPCGAEGCVGAPGPTATKAGARWSL